MLEYEWGNPSSIMLSADEHEPASGSDPIRHHNILEHYANAQNAFSDSFLPPPQHSNNPTASFAHHFNPHQVQVSQGQGHHHNHNHNHHALSLYDPRAYAATSSYAPPQPLSMLSLDSVTGGGGHGGQGFMLVPKSEEVCRPVDFASRIGLNLGGRTYFSSEDDFMNRLYRRQRPVEPGSSNSPRCQAEGCNADLSHAKHYHRRHKVCEFHSKASTVIAAGLTQRFCQQCSRFHLLSEFDNGKRSCRKRLADHNRRRRKTQQPNQENPKLLAENSRILPSDNVERSPPDSGAQSSSSVTVAVSPPRMSLVCFRQRSYQSSTSSSVSSSSLFFSNG
ncbi:hypothetical protein FEM48_Zijuj08G0059500 [Ziziphus jujuba var. spinosa]|uniref:SBP-type domain-containing protein n=1 Tax=Ziziphus jujuba var. spinosa TaxID=714518 RepID=A0A978UXD3_ZIZJJ|nr:hypothetical protein FEM48_Zijuj08G0059500 [Ziziphus jujuba var. spinosa]